MLSILGTEPYISFHIGCLIILFNELSPTKIVERYFIQNFVVLDDFLSFVVAHLDFVHIFIFLELGHR